jgi:hypothetical protein
MPWIAWLVLGVGVVVLIVYGLAALGASLWADATRALLGKLEAARLPESPARYDATELGGLPPPVQRYFRAVLKNGQRIVRAVTVDHTGTFNVSPTGGRWLPFTSRQRVVTRSPGFLWNARMDIVPGLPVRVHDPYVGGEGTLRVAALGLFGIADFHGPRNCQGRTDAFLRRGGVVPDRAAAEPGGPLGGGG